MSNTLPYPAKGGTQYTTASSKLEKKILLPNAPLGFRKLRKVDGAGGGISIVSWWRMGYYFADQMPPSPPKKAVSQGFFAEGLTRHAKQSRCHAVTNWYLLDVGRQPRSRKQQH